MSVKLRDFFSLWCDVNLSVSISSDFKFSEFNINCCSKIFFSLTSDVWDDKCEWLKDIKSKHEITSDEFKIFFSQFNYLCSVSMFIESSARVSFLSLSIFNFWHMLFWLTLWFFFFFRVMNSSVISEWLNECCCINIESCSSWESRKRSSQENCFIQMIKCKLFELNNWNRHVRATLKCH